jgi:hypothetical protein
MKSLNHPWVSRRVSNTDLNLREISHPICQTLTFEKKTKFRRRLPRRCSNAGQACKLRPWKSNTRCGVRAAPSSLVLGPVDQGRPREARVGAHSAGGLVRAVPRAGRGGREAPGGAEGSPSLQTSGAHIHPNPLCSLSQESLCSIPRINPHAPSLSLSPKPQPLAPLPPLIIKPQTLNPRHFPLYLL